jgi:hypothetical protein
VNVSRAKSTKFHQSPLNMSVVDHEYILEHDQDDQETTNF